MKLIAALAFVLLLLLAVFLCTGCKKTETRTVYSDEGRGFERMGVLGAWHCNAPISVSGAMVMSTGPIDLDFLPGDIIAANWPIAGNVPIRVYPSNMVFGTQAQWIGYYNEPDTVPNATLWKVMILINGPVGSGQMTVTLVDENSQSSFVIWNLGTLAAHG